MQFRKTGGGTAGLSKPQKVTATAMAFVLAVGLTPFVQPPAQAQADDGSNTFTVQAGSAVISTQEQTLSPNISANMSPEGAIKILKDKIEALKKMTLSAETQNDYFKALDDAESAAKVFNLSPAKNSSETINLSPSTNHANSLGDLMKKLTDLRTAYDKFANPQEKTESDTVLAALEALDEAINELKNGSPTMDGYDKLIENAEKALNFFNTSPTVLPDNTSKVDQARQTVEEAKKKYEEVKLAQAKANAINDLSEYVANKGKYRDAEQAEINKLVEAGNKAISKAETIEAVATALQNAKDEIDKIKTDAQLTEEEKAAENDKPSTPTNDNKGNTNNNTTPTNNTNTTPAASDATKTTTSTDTPAATTTDTGLAKGETATTGKGATAAKVKATSDTAVEYTAPANKKAKKITVPATVKVGDKTYKVTSIAANAFKGSAATTIVVGKNVTKIGKGAFANCKKLKSVTLGKNVKTIGKNAFKGCKKLKKVTLQTSKLTKASMKNMLKGSKIKTLKLKGVSKKAKKNYKKWAKAYGVTVK